MPTSAPSSAPDAQTIQSAAFRFLGRQPILDAQQMPFGHELLFRDSLQNNFSGDSETATRQVIDNILTLGLDAIAAHGKVFLNCTKQTLADGVVTLLPPAAMVLEVLETIDVDDEVVNSCSALKQKGFQIALDDYTPSPGMDRLLDLADYVKIDFRASDAAARRKIKRHVRGRSIALLAEKVETGEEFAQALEEGFSYFQGYFFAHPVISGSREIPASKMVCLQLLSAVSGTPCDRALVERLVMADTAFCFRLLRLVNSAGMGIRNTVRTVRQAMTMIGEDELRKLVMVASAITLGKDGNVPSELILLGLQRARFCEMMSAPARLSAGEQYLVGMLSVMDAMLLLPIDKVIGMVPLHQDASAVLLGSDGPLSVPLRLLKAYQNKDWTTCETLCRGLRLSEERLGEIYIASLRWAAHQVREAGWRS